MSTQSEVNQSKTTNAKPRIPNIVLVALAATCFMVALTNHLFFHFENSKTLNPHVVFVVFFLVPDIVGGISAGVFLGRIIKPFLRR